MSGGPIGVVVVGGVFDGLHAGHVNLLQIAALHARRAGLRLVVLLNSDESVRDLARVTQHTAAQRGNLIRVVVPDAEVVEFNDATPVVALTSLLKQMDEDDDLVGKLALFIKGVDTIEGGRVPAELGLERVACYYHPVTFGPYARKLSTRR